MLCWLLVEVGGLEPRNFVLAIDLHSEHLALLIDDTGFAVFGHLPARCATLKEDVFAFELVRVPKEVMPLLAEGQQNFRRDGLRLFSLEQLLAPNEKLA
jgi:hypothetical protein